MQEMVLTMAQVWVLPLLLHHLVAGLTVPDKTVMPTGAAIRLASHSVVYIMLSRVDGYRDIWLLGCVHIS